MRRYRRLLGIALGFIVVFLLLLLNGEISLQTPVSVIASLITVALMATEIGGFLKGVWTSRTELSNDAVKERIIAKQEELWVEGVSEPAMTNKEQKEPFYLKFTKISGNDTDSPSKNGDPSKTIIDEYHDAYHQLVILGKGGTGKTVTLAQLLSKLLILAKEPKSSRPLPVIFDLANWSRSGGHSLETWFINELSELLGADALRGKKAIRRLVQKRRLVFLVDGFDETPNDGTIRANLLEDIQNFVQDEPSILSETRLVLTSRPDAYLALKRELKGFTVVEVDKLTAEDTKEFLSSSQKYIASHIKQSKQLEQLSEIPFIMNALATVYTEGMERSLEKDLKRTKEIEIDSNASLTPIPEVIIRRLIGHRIDVATHTPFSSKETDQHLTWLARRLAKTDSDSGFLIDSLQPDWLPNPVWKWFYILLSRMFGATAIMLGIGFLLASPLDYLSIGFFAGAVIGIVDGLLRYTQLGDVKIVNPTLTTLIQIAVKYLITSLALSLWLGLTTLAPEQDRVLSGAISLTGVNLSWFLALCIVFSYSLRKLKIDGNDDIKLGDDKFIFSLYSDIRRFLLFLFIGGTTIGIVVGIYAQIISQQQSSSIGLWLQNIISSSDYFFVTSSTIGFSVGFVIGGIISGFFSFYSVSEQTEKWLRPNQGVVKSLTNTARIALSFSPIFAILCGALFWFIQRDIDAVWRGIRNGIAIGVLLGLLFGGIDTIHHATLRLALFLSGRIPRNFPSFLKHITKQLDLMRETGAYYKFSHEYISQYYRVQEIPVFVWRKRQFLIIIIVASCVLLLSIPQIRLSVTNYILYDWMLPRNAMYEVGNREEVTSTDMCVTAGQEAIIKSWGKVRSGNFVGYLPPEGTEIGLMGLPLGDTYDLPDITVNAFNNALLCKLDTEDTQDWQVCAERPPGRFYQVYPWTERTKNFSATQDGCFEFTFNQMEWKKRIGGIFVAIEPVSP